jgi:predicted O-methyltransferase YrrM
MSTKWTAEAVLALARSYQGACVLNAAAELDLFRALAGGARTARQLAVALRGHPRGTAILLDALTALRLLEKRHGRYALAPGTADLLSPAQPGSVLPMVQHQANCLRRWSQLARVVRTGRPAPRTASVRGKAGDQAAFIGAMHTLALPAAHHLIRAIRPLQFEHLLDVGGASGTWTLAFLRACPSGRATLFDLPNVIPMARWRLREAGVADRVRFVAGDFLTDPLPGGADLAWISAIVHQNSRAQNRRLFANTARALIAGGRVAIRDVLMEEDRVRPVAGALFAVNMLVATEGGGTYTLNELRADLRQAGFAQVRQVRRDDGMNAILVARKPAPHRNRIRQPV